MIRTEKWRMVLKGLVGHHRRKDLRKLRGRAGIRLDYDYKPLRECRNDTRDTG
jgi:hypothetical protein